MIKFFMPCAGFGTRVQHRLAGQISKELLPDPETKRPLIEKHLDLAMSLLSPVHIILRQEKQDLITYLKQRQNLQKIEIQIISPSKEWPDTLLMAKSFFMEKNILILPDTVFSPASIVEAMAEELHRVPLVYATHDVKDPWAWGILKDQAIWEKPSDPIFNSMAWGLIAFRREIGETVFAAHLQSTLLRQKIALPISFKTLLLSDFHDLTRI